MAPHDADQVTIVPPVAVPMTAPSSPENIPPAHDKHRLPSRFDLHQGMPTSALVVNILMKSMPLGLAAVSQFSMGTVLVAMVGRVIGDAELGATSLAFGLINATAFSAAAGFCGALETVLSQSYARDPHSKMYGIYAQRMGIMLLMISVLFSPIMLFSEQFLKAINIDPLLAQNTGRFCRIATIGLFPAMMLELLRRYFACQHLNNPLSVNLVSGAVAFPLFLYPLLKLFGFVGAPVAWCLLMCGMSGSLVLYLWYTGKYKRTWGSMDKSALRNWVPLLKLALPSMAMMLSEWAALEVNAVVAGYAPQQELAAFSMMYQLSAILWGIVSGVFIYVAVLVGGAVAQNRNGFARRCAGTCFVVSTAMACVNIAILVLFRNYIPRIFTKDEKTLEIFKSILPIYAFYHVCDCVQSCMMGILRGCGKQNIGAITVAIVYSVVGVPSGVLMFVFTDIGVRALWIGPTIGVVCVGLPMYMYMFFRYIKWDELEPEEDNEGSLHLSEDEHMSIIGVDTIDSRHVSDGDEDMADSGHRTANRSFASDLADLDDAVSVISNFHIPRRNVLLTQYTLPGIHPIASAADQGVEDERKTADPDCEQCLPSEPSSRSDSPDTNKQ